MIMMYKQEITQRHRTAFIIAIDQSESMLGEVSFNNRKVSKAVAVTEITDNLIDELILRALRNDEVRDYYDIALLGYADNKVYPLIQPERFFIPVSELLPLKIEQKTRLVERFLPDGSLRQYKETQNVWIKPHAHGNTPMYEAMMKIRELVTEWCNKPQNRDSFPPIVFNITDGITSDCHGNELFAITEQIRSISTTDGNVLLINIHLASGDYRRSVIFPSDDEIDTDNHCLRLLAECSSYMPDAFNELIRAQRGNWVKPPFRAMSFNSSIVELIAMFNIGSRSVTNIL